MGVSQSLFFQESTKKIVGSESNRNFSSKRHIILISVGCRICGHEMRSRVTYNVGFWD